MEIPSSNIISHGENIEIPEEGKIDDKMHIDNLDDNKKIKSGDKLLLNLNVIHPKGLFLFNFGMFCLASVF